MTEKIDNVKRINYNTIVKGGKAFPKTKKVITCSTWKK